MTLKINPGIVRKSALLLLALLPLLLVPSCKNHHGRRSSPEVINELNYLSLDLDYYNGNQTRYFELDGTYSDFNVEFRVRHFDYGACRVRIYDADGIKVLDNDYYVNDFNKTDEEYLDLDVTAIGTPGLWTVRLDLDQFDGHLYFILD